MHSRYQRVISKEMNSTGGILTVFIVVLLNFHIGALSTAVPVIQPAYSILTALVYATKRRHGITLRDIDVSVFFG